MLLILIKNNNFENYSDFLNIFHNYLKILSVKQVDYLCDNHFFFLKHMLKMSMSILYIPSFIFQIVKHTSQIPRNVLPR